jgi:flagellar biosynthesis/type III secretory pathway chaperone
MARVNALVEDQTVSEVAVTWPESGGTALAEAFAGESRLLESLIEVLRRQRDAVARDELAVVDETVYAAQRIFRTLAEARRKRRSLLQAVAGSSEIPLRDMEASLGPLMTPSLGAAVGTLRTRAQELAQELEVSRRVISGAIRSGEDLIFALCGKKAPPKGYGPDATLARSPAEGGVIINRTI